MLENLNPAQLEAVNNLEGPLLVFAGAGSGKTRVLTYRVARLLQEGVDPYNIIAITFTNKAAREMRERITNITVLGEQVWVSTFHSMCTRILRREIEILGFSKNFSIYDADDSLRLIKNCISECNLSDKFYIPKVMAGIISTQKNELVTPEEFEATATNDRDAKIAELYHHYQKRLKANNALDFDDLIMLTFQLFDEHPQVLERYRQRFRYVLVDEYQDTNHAQYQLVK